MILFLFVSGSTGGAAPITIPRETQMHRVSETRLLFRVLDSLRASLFKISIVVPGRSAIEL